jgi:hypothetical protein
MEGERHARAHAGLMRMTILASSRAPPARPQIPVKRDYQHYYKGLLLMLATEIAVICELEATTLEIPPGVAAPHVKSTTVEPA